jgi:hypothetical protein
LRILLLQRHIMHSGVATSELTLIPRQESAQSETGRLLPSPAALAANGGNVQAARWRDASALQPADNVIE